MGRLLRGDIAEHRAWMLRSYAMAFAAVTLRFYLALYPVVGMDRESAYQLISWLAWVPNVLYVEWVVLARKPRALASS